MANLKTLRTDFVARVQKELPDSLDQVVLVLFAVSVILSLAKALIVVPFYLDNNLAIPLMALAIGFRIAIFYVLYKQPRHVILLTKIALVLMSLYILLFIYFSPDGLNFIRLQHIFIVIMLAFYAINRFWGIAFSGVFFVTVLLHMLEFGAGQFGLVLFPEKLPFYAAFAIVFLNFIQIAFIHFLYHQTLRKTVDEMRALNEQLQESVAAKSNFLSTMSHELRTPLNSVIGSAYLLIDSDVNESQ